MRRRFEVRFQLTQTMHLVYIMFTPRMSVCLLSCLRSCAECGQYSSICILYISMTLRCDFTELRRFLHLLDAIKPIPKTRWRYVKLLMCVHEPTTSLTFYVNKHKTPVKGLKSFKTRCRAKPDVNPPGCATSRLRHALLLLPYANAIYRTSPKLSCVDKTDKNWLPWQRPLGIKN